MSVRDLVRRKQGKNLPARRMEPEQGGLISLQREMNRLFDSFFHGWDLDAFQGFGQVATGSFNPRVNVDETDKEVSVTAELPGLDEKDVSVELDENILTIRGEKKDEREEQGRDWHRVERSYGSFHRSIALPATPDAAKVKAEFKKGILTVSLPKRKEDQGRRRTIEIKTE